MLLLHGALPISPAPPSLPSAAPLFWRQRISAMPTLRSTLLHSLSGLALLTATPSAAAPAPSASVADPISARTEGIGPYQRVVLRNVRSEEHTSELQSLMLYSYAVFCLYT